MKILPKILLCLFISISAKANDFAFDGLDQSNVDDVFKEFAATFTHTTVSGAASKAKIFGFEFGLLGGLTQSDELKELASRSGAPDAEKISVLPFASIYGLVSLPLGFTVEANFIPEIEIQDVEFDHLSLAVKYEFTSLIEESPVNLAVKAFMINSNLKVTQTTANYNGDVKFNQSQFGLQGLVSKKMPIIEPYAFLGLVSARGELEAKGTGSIFNGSFTATGKQQADSDATSVQFGLGLQANLLIVKTGIEYVNTFGAHHLNAKFALSF